MLVWFKIKLHKVTPTHRTVQYFCRYFYRKFTKAVFTMRNIFQKLCSTTQTPGFKYQMVAPLKKNQYKSSYRNSKKFAKVRHTHHTTYPANNLHA